jgi:ATP-dependent Clp protease ATP-binding subunit ClpA
VRQAIDRALADRLKRLRVGVGTADDNMIALNNVPANRAFFNKPRTNLLVTRPDAHLPCLTCVDEDLEYTGPDLALARIFAAAVTRDGWRVILVSSPVAGSLQEVVERALRIVGFAGAEPALESRAGVRSLDARSGLIARFGVDLCTDERTGPSFVIGRREEITEIVSCLLQWRARLPLVVGEPGVGKTHVLRAVARQLIEVRPARRAVAVDLGQLFAGTLHAAERENLIAELLGEAIDTTDVVLAIERLDLALAEAPHGAMVLARAVERGALVIGTALPEHLPTLEACAALARHLHVVGLDELSADETLEIAHTLLGPLSTHHDVQLDEACARAAVERSRSLRGAWPAKAIALLDAAVTRARLDGATSVEPVHVYLAASRIAEVEEP